MVHCQLAPAVSSLPTPDGVGCRRAPQNIVSSSAVESGTHNNVQVINPPILCASRDCRGCFSTPSSRSDWTPLIAASARGCSVEVSHFVQTKSNIDTENANVNCVDGHGRTALWHACDQNRAAIVTILCGHPDVDANVLDVRGWSALCCAAQKDHVECVKALIASGRPNLNLAGARGGATAIIVACREGATRTLEALVNCAGIELFATDSESRTGVWHAALNSHPNAISIMAEAAAAKSGGGGLNEFTNALAMPALSGESVLRASCVRGELNTIQLLLKFGALAGHVDPDGSTPLLECTSWAHRAAAYVLMRTKKASVHSMRVDGVVCLHQACWAADMKLVRDLAPRPKRTPGGKYIRGSKMRSKRVPPRTPSSSSSLPGRWE